MINIQHTEVQKEIIDKINKGNIAIIKEGKPIAYVLTPQNLEDYIDNILAEQAEKEGMLSIEETETFLNEIKNA